jgi:uncharacterized protein (TIGR02722 family)
MKRIAFSLLILASLTLVSACNRTVTRIDPNTSTDLSGRWNDTDSRLVAEELTKQALNEAWRANFMAANKRLPVIIVGVIQNKSSEHIEAETYIKDMERTFINTGQVRVVQNAMLREAMRKEKGDQAQFASQETQKKFGKELGADFMVFGNIFSTEDAYQKKRTITYQVSLEFANIETNELVWVGDKKIKKFIRN